MKRLIYICIITFLFFHPLHLFPEASLYVLSTDISAFPTINAEFFAFDENGKIITNYNTTDFEVNDNGMLLDINDVACPASAPFDEVSLTIAFDLSQSRDYSSNLHYPKALSLISALVDSGDLNSAEVAITSYSFFSYLNNDFTKDREKLRNSLKMFDGQPSSFLDTGWISLPGGALEVAARGTKERVVIFITDSYRQFDDEAAIAYAKSNNIRVFVVSTSDFITDGLQRLAIETGGKYFFEAALPERTTALTKTLLSYAFNYSPCRMTINGQLNCDELHRVRIRMPIYDIISDIKYNLPSIYKPRLESEPSYIGFSTVLPMTSTTKDILLTARNGDIEITKFSFLEPEFEIVAGDVPTGGRIVIPNGESHSVTVKFSPVDSAIIYTPLVIESNACDGNKIFITGGFPNTPPKTQTINIFSPYAGETLLIGDTLLIEWEGLLPADVIQLEYSFDNGTTWDTLATDVTNLQYKWTIPDTNVQNGYIRAIQLWPNNIGETKDFKHLHRVNDGKFNKKDGRWMVTACSDSVARLWNANSGQLLLSFIGHKGIINTAEIDSTERYVITASDDSTAKLWSAQDASLIHTFTGHSGIVTSASFDNEGKKCVTSSFDGTIKIWDLQSFSLIRTINCSQYRVRYAVFSPDGSKVLTAGSNGTVKAWDAVTGDLLKTFNTKSTGETFERVAFSPDGDKTMGASWFGKAYVWDYETTDTIYTVTHSDTMASTNSIFSVCMQRTGIPLTFRHYKIDKNSLLLLTTAIDGARIWDGNTGKLIAKLIEHRSSLHSAFFNFDGSRILTTSWDSTAKIWNLDKRGLQLDTSGRFAIARPNAICPDVDFKRVAVGEALDTTIIPYLINNVGFAYKIIDITITGANADCFSIIDGLPPFTLDSAEERQIRLCFTPKTSGLHQADINMILPGGLFTRKLTGNGYDPGLLAITKTVDFGSVETGSFKDTTILLSVKNATDHSVKIHRIIEAGPDSLHFSVLPDFDSIVVSPNQTLPLRLRFSPEEAGRTSGQIYYIHDADGSPTRIIVYGEGIKPRIDSVEVYLDDFSAMPGESVDVKVKIRNYRKSSSDDGFPALSAELLFNSSLLYPIGYSSSKNISNGIRRLPVTFNNSIDADSSIATITFKAALGNDTTTVISFDNLKPIQNKRILITSSPATFTLKGYCDDGGLRLFEPDGRISLSQNVPNPVSSTTDISFEVLEPGMTELIVYNMTGIAIREVVKKYLIPGKYQINFNASDMPAGAYYYVLKTKNHTMMRRMDIIK